MEQLEINAGDGQALAVTVFPAAALNRLGRTVLIGAAAGVPQRFYRAYALFLANAGFDTVTFDFRGVGGSRIADVRNSAATFLDWGRLDFPAAVQLCRSRWPTQRIDIVGHSAGAWLLALNPLHAEVASLVAVASGGMYWRDVGSPDRYFLRALWTAGVPLVTRLWGYAPGWLGLKLDLGAAHARQWARWSLAPEGMFADEALRALAIAERFTGHITAVTIEDDRWARAAAVRAMYRRFTAARVDFVELTRADAGSTVGHFGFFRREFAERLWPRSLQWLDAGL